MLLAFSAKPEELDILMLSLTFGNVDVQRYVPLLSFASFHAPKRGVQNHDHMNFSRLTNAACADYALVA